MLERLKNKLKTPEDVSRWLLANVRYVDTKFLRFPKKWRTVEEAYDLKAGNCVDFALLANYLLDERSQILGIYKNKEAHAICLFGWREKLWYISNGELYKESDSLWDGCLFWAIYNDKGEVLESSCKEKEKDYTHTDLEGTKTAPIVYYRGSQITICE